MIYRIPDDDEPERFEIDPDAELSRYHNAIDEGICPWCRSSNVLRRGKDVYHRHMRVCDRCGASWSMCERVDFR